MTHCDNAITDHAFPDCLRYFLLVNRMPASEKHLVISMVGEPKCFATYKKTNERVQIVMASRFGDVGITSNLNLDVHGYNRRVSIDDLEDFSEQA